MDALASVIGSPSALQEVKGAKGEREREFCDSMCSVMQPLTMT